MTKAELIQKWEENLKVIEYSYARAGNNFEADYNLGKSVVVKELLADLKQLEDKEKK